MRSENRKKGPSCGGGGLTGTLIIVVIALKGNFQRGGVQILCRCGHPSGKLELETAVSLEDASSRGVDLQVAAEDAERRRRIAPMRVAARMI